MNRSLPIRRRGRATPNPVSQVPRCRPTPAATALEAELRRLLSELDRLAAGTGCKADVSAALAKRLHTTSAEERRHLRHQMLALASGLQDVAVKSRAAAQDAAGHLGRLDQHTAASRAYSAVAKSSKR